MKLVVRAYGRFLLESIVVLSMVMLLIQQGYLQFVGQHIQTVTEDYSEYTDFREHYYWECQKDAPKILYVKGSIETGSYSLSELVEAYDYEGKRLEVGIERILTSQMEEQIPEYGEETYLNFEKAGIYSIEVSAEDDGNRCSRRTIKIPVNNRRDGG